MSAQRGKNILLKMDNPNAPGQLVTVGGLRAKTISLNAQPVDTTHAESEGWRELLSGAGLRQASVSGSGVFIDDMACELIRASFFAGEIFTWQLIIPDFGSITGGFQITNLDYAGDFRSEATMSLALESAGVLTFEVLS